MERKEKRSMMIEAVETRSQFMVSLVIAMEPLGHRGVGIGGDAQDEFHPVGDPNAREDAREMGADGPEADLQLLGDLLVPFSFEN